MLYWTFILWGSIWLQQIGPGGMLESPTCDPGSSRKRGINCRWIVKGTPLSSHFPRLMAQESPAYSWLLLLRSKSNGFHITHTHQDKMGLPLAGGPHQAPKVMELWPRSVVGKDWLQRDSTREFCRWQIYLDCVGSYRSVYICQNS